MLLGGNPTNVRGVVIANGTSLGAFTQDFVSLSFQNNYYNASYNLWFPFDLFISSSYACSNITNGTSLNLTVEAGQTVETSPLAITFGTVDVDLNAQPDINGTSPRLPSIRYDFTFGSMKLTYISTGVFRFTAGLQGTDPDGGALMNLTISGVADLYSRPSTVSTSVVIKRGLVLYTAKTSGFVYGDSGCLGAPPQTSTSSETASTTETVTTTDVTSTTLMTTVSWLRGNRTVRSPGLGLTLF